MFCNKCGNQFEGNFCHKCGAPVRNAGFPEAPAQNTYQNRPAEYGGNIGASLKQLGTVHKILIAACLSIIICAVVFMLTRPGREPVDSAAFPGVSEVSDIAGSQAPLSDEDAIKECITGFIAAINEFDMPKMMKYMSGNLIANAGAESFTDFAEEEIREYVMMEVTGIEVRSIDPHEAVAYMALRIAIKEDSPLWIWEEMDGVSSQEQMCKVTLVKENNKWVIADILF